MTFPGLGVVVEDSPGTVVALVGKVVRHGVSACTGDRIVYAYYMRDKVHERMDIMTVDFMTQQGFGSHVIEYMERQAKALLEMDLAMGNMHL